MGVLVVGLNHKTVPLRVLERVAFPPQALPKSLAGLVGHDPIHEGVILSTCNRTEIYATVHRFHPAVQSVRRFLSDASGVGEHEVSNGLYTYYDGSAIRHLFSVASGIDSMVLGEPQILGQVREAYLAAQQEGTARRLLGSLFQRALRVGKRARTETAIARHVVSLPQAAARVAASTAGLERPRAVVVGAGRMGELAARAVLDLGTRDLTICNRTPGRAAELSERLGVRWAGLDRLPGLLAEADIVLCATTATEPVIERSALEAAVRERSRPIAVVDLGVPRNLDPSCRELGGVELRDMDDLREVAESGARQRLAEVPKVEAIVDEEVDAFSAWERSLALGPAIAALRAAAEDIRAAEVARTVRRHGAEQAEREALDALTRGIVNKLLHAPVTRMKDLVGDKDGQVYLEVFRELFDLDASGP